MNNALLSFAPLLFFIQSHTCQINEKTLLRDFHIEVKPHSSWIQELNAGGALTHQKIEKQRSSTMIPLFKQYPNLQFLPYVSLCSLPTPVQKLESLSTMLNASLYIKRDDLTGSLDNNGIRSYGGNKPRKLEFELGNALAHGAKTVVTFGAAGSNHAVATSEYARILGLTCVCMLKPQANSTGVRKNLLLHLNNESELHYYPTNDTRKLGTIFHWLDHKNTYGEYPYIIPTGGSSPLGTIGFVNAAFELQEQIKAGLLPKPDRLYVPCGSLATMVGLMLGCKAAGLATKVIGVAVEPHENRDEFITNIKKLYKDTNELLHSFDASFGLFDIADEDIHITYDFCGPQYAVFTPQGIQARELLHSTEHILLDGTYTAKAFAALLEDIKTKPHSDEIILFWNTYCGIEFAERIAQEDYKKLPVCFHTYFEEDVQELDKA